MWYQNVLKPALFRLNPELAHDLAYSAGRILSNYDGACDLVSRITQSCESKKGVELWGLHFPNRVGLAAGFDKNGHLPPIVAALGFGFTEIGSITAMASDGNPKPRMFRLPGDKALVNRMGLNNDGARVICDRLVAQTRFKIPLGINIAKTHNPAIMGDRAVEDYSIAFREAVRVANYITVNISCPNTEEGKTFEEPDTLNTLLKALSQEPRDRGCRRVPVLVKLSADLSEGALIELLAVCEKFSIDGYVAVNTSSSRAYLHNSSDSEVASIGRGGLSGAPLLQRACTTIERIKSFTDGKKPVIGVGGITCIEDAITMRKAGADLIQIYTGLVYNGPMFASNLARALD
ncbi:MAG: quinone-dependent dihydroorotate dehydrogenase [Bacteroidetes bacterium]|nr:quinone-dependent dihydroorotate dehydrogenase [Bacteroidota bacterium]MCH8523112.1 quinone-dependent dihydroorotate dehydrogenase [Balneolales bacterium]